MYGFNTVKKDNGVEGRYQDKMFTEEADFIIKDGNGDVSFGFTVRDNNEEHEYFLHTMAKNLNKFDVRHILSCLEEYTKKTNKLDYKNGDSIEDLIFDHVKLVRHTISIIMSNTKLSLCNLYVKDNTKHIVGTSLLI